MKYKNSPEEFAEEVTSNLDLCRTSRSGNTKGSGRKSTLKKRSVISLPTIRAAGALVLPPSLTMEWESGGWERKSVYSMCLEIGAARKLALALLNWAESIEEVERNKSMPKRVSK